MKKNSLLFVFGLIMALMVFGTAFAQEALPPIDEAEAEAYLGTWHMTEMCYEESCMAVSAFGVDAVLEVKADNTMVLSGLDEEETDPIPWYMEDGKAYFLSEAEEEGTYNTNEFAFDEDGSLLISGEGVVMKFSREGVVNWGTGEIKADADLSDFEGEWYLNSFVAEGISLPVSMFGITGKLVIAEDALSFSMMDEGYEDVAYELKDGIITASVTNEEGQESTMVLEYHVEGAVVMVLEAGTENEARMCFVREENLTDMDLSSLLGGLEGMMEEEAEAVVE